MNVRTFPSAAFVVLTASLVTAAFAGTASAQVASRCDQARLKLAAQYTKCLMKAETRAAASGGIADLASCDSRLVDLWGSVEARDPEGCSAGMRLDHVQRALSQCSDSAVHGTGRQFDVIFDVQTSAPVGSLMFEVQYAAAPGSFAGEGARVECSPVRDTDHGAFNDVDAAGRLTIGFVSLDGVSSDPAGLVSCRFSTDGWVDPAPEDFAIHTLVADGPKLEQIQPIPRVVVHSIEAVEP